MSKICQNCNSILSDNHKFCTKCGAKIVDKLEEKRVVSDNKNNLNTKESTGTYYKIGAFLILIGIALFFGLNKNNNAIPQEEIIKKKSEQQPIIKKEDDNKTKKTVDNNYVQKELTEYVIDYIDKVNKRYMGSIKELYANNIKSFSDITYSKEKVFKEKEDYFKRWNIFQMKLNNIESINTDKNNGNHIIKYNMSFLAYSTNKIKGIRGEALNTLILNSDMKIIEEQQTILSKMNFTNPNELLNTFFDKKVNNANYENNTLTKIIISNYPRSEGEIPESLLITKYNDKYLNFYKSGFFIDSFEYLDENKILIRLSNTTANINYIFDLKNNSNILLGGGSTIELINQGEYKGFFKVSGIKTYLIREDGSPEGAHWFDAIKNSDGKIVKFISTNSNKCVSIERLINKEDIKYLRQSLNDCIFVDY